jgi:hypothetical protein
MSNVNDLQLLLVRAGIGFSDVNEIPPESRDTCSSAIASSEITGHETVGVVDSRIRVQLGLAAQTLHL